MGFKVQSLEQIAFRAAVRQRFCVWDCAVLIKYEYTAMMLLLFRRLVRILRPIRLPTLLLIPIRQFRLRLMPQLIP